MLSILKAIFGGMTSKKLTKTIVDSKLGKLTNEYTGKDEYFSWYTELVGINGDRSETAIYIDGDLNSPYSQALELARTMIDQTARLTHEVQIALDKKFPQKGLDLSKGYSLTDMSFFYDPEDADATDFEMEFSSDSTEMVSAGFKDNQLVELDLY